MTDWIAVLDVCHRVTPVVCLEDVDAAAVAESTSVRVLRDVVTAAILEGGSS